MKEHPRSPKRVVFGPGPSYVAWQPHGDFTCSPGASKSVQELLKSASNFYTSIRLVALGVSETYIIIWEDGTIRWDLKHHYGILDDVLEGCEPEDISVSISLPYIIRHFPDLFLMF